MQNKRLFFTCPIKAAWMWKEFGVVCYVELSSEGKIYDKFKINDWYGRSLKIDAGEKFFVAAESEDIFNPKEGDKSHGNTFDALKNKWCGHRQHKAEDYEIERRDNKAFFSPEVEDAK